MITIPWLYRKKSHEGPAFVMTSRFEVKSTTNVPRFLALAMVAYAQAARAEGVVGVSLRASPLKRTFWTLSSWVDREHLQQYARTKPHANISRSLGPVTKSSRFVFFDAPTRPAPSWDEALERLRAADEAAG